ncbi:MAG: hypothetical protein B6242_09165 [Anaerolineaceae bacterium 4572_78]|nr:MAG: hypothetical protein B6242_09165 [Anaerolineaceae bacterium 4572_78]
MIDIQTDRLIDQQLGSYKIVEPIGQGGMARVYKGYHADLDRYAAIKIIAWGLAEDKSLTTRFRREAQAIASLRHSHIVTIYDFGKYENGYYMVMEYIDGEDIETFINRHKPIPPKAIQSLISDIAAALDYAHSHGVVHRDVKPSNIMLTNEGEAILTDFGLVMLSNSMGSTTIGSSFGTPYYMAPEQAMSASDASHASDIYSLGVILFEMIAGTPPYVADSPLGVALKHISDPVPNIQNFVADTPDTVNAVIQKAMAKAPQDRFTTATEMAETLTQVWDLKEIQEYKSLGIALVHRKDTALLVQRGNTPSPTRKIPQFIWGMVIVMVILIIGGLFNIFQVNSANSDSSTPFSLTSQPNIIVDIPTPTPTATFTATPSAMPTNTPTPNLEITDLPIAIPSTSTSTLTPTDTSTHTPIPPTETPTTIPPTIIPTYTPAPTNTQLFLISPTPIAKSYTNYENLKGQILFKSNRGGRVEIYRMNPDGSDQQAIGVDYAYLYNDAIRWESYSPDGTEILVVRGDGEQTDLWRAFLVQHKSELKITNDLAPDYDPVWSPVDNRIAFVSERTGNGDIYVLDLNGSSIIRMIYNEVDFDKHPSWSPDGQQIVYWSNRGWNNNRQIWVLHLETKETLSLSNNPYEDWDPVWVK